MQVGAGDSAYGGFQLHFFRTPREGLSPVLGVALTPGVSPRCQVTGRVHANSFLLAGSCGRGQTHSLT